MRFIRVLFVALAATLSLAVVSLLAASCGSDENVDAGASGSDATKITAEQLSFTAAEIGGGEFDASSLEGKDSVLWFWAPWCTVCRAEAPDVVRSIAAVGDEVQFVGVAGRGEVPAMEGFIDDTNTGGFTNIVDADGSIWSRFNVAAQPAYAFIDDKGGVEVHIGALGQEALTEKMEALAAN